MVGGGGYLYCIGLYIGGLGVEVILGLLPGCTGGVPPLGRETPGLGADGQVRLGVVRAWGERNWVGVGGRTFWFWDWLGVGLPGT